ncbi:flagellar hook-length control protein [Thioalkalivibrio sp. K90mix]|uniref:flagellar hook-length control protein FliK n=1 Tax=Thioalkalivibrio sp. (strain K90mix) TaxID=396595 RepID=UPI000195A60C|nr:flagellar hook-length control protein FliK [Thioalkalivibrio sp. K90mix]ADC71672.1 flagellar hook-length control protein [Thioalkalivibrio sp. K90mix]
MIATGNAGQGMMPLLQLLGAGSDLKDLQALEGLEGLKDLKTADGEGFLDILRPQLEALLVDLGVGEEELEGLDLDGMLARLQSLMDEGELAVEVEPGGKDLPLAALMTAVDDRPGPPVARMDRADESGGAREIKPLPAAVMRLFLESSQGPAGSTGSGSVAGIELLGPNSRLSRENVLELLAQWMSQGTDTQRGQVRAEPLAGILPAHVQAAEGSEGSRSSLRLDLARLLQPGGERELTDQIRMLARAQGGRTEIKLHPPQLGTLDVRLNVDGDRATVQFISANPVTREVLEAAMPRLRESLAQSGLTLEDATVSDQTAEEHEGQQALADGQRARNEADEPEAEGEQATGSTLSMLNRRLDLFA